MNVLLLALNWLLVGGIVLGLAAVAALVVWSRRPGRSFGVGAWLLVAGVALVLALQVPRWGEGASLSVGPGPTWSVENPWGWTLATIGPTTSRGLHSTTVTSTSAVTADNRLQTAAGGPAARTISVRWASLIVETQADAWTFHSPPSAAELGYPPDIVAMLAVTGGLNPHTFDADGPVFGESEGRRMLSTASAGDPVDVFWGDHWESAVLVEIGSSRYKLKREDASTEDWVRPFLVRRPQALAAPSSRRVDAR